MRCNASIVAAGSDQRVDPLGAVWMDRRNSGHGRSVVGPRRTLPRPAAISGLTPSDRPAGSAQECVGVRRLGPAVASAACRRPPSSRMSGPRRSGSACGAAPRCISLFHASGLRGNTLHRKGLVRDWKREPGRNGQQTLNMAHAAAEFPCEQDVLPARCRLVIRLAKTRNQPPKKTGVVYATDNRARCLRSGCWSMCSS